MSKFRRVSETKDIPQFIESKFVRSAAEMQDDPYAELRARAEENQAKIAKAQRGLSREAAPKDRSWERIEGASIYEDRRDMTLEERLAALRIEDTSRAAVRRASYQVDEGDNARNLASLKAFSPDEYMSAMMNRSASIFEPDMYEIADAFAESQEASSQQALADAQQRREARANRHKAWEDEHTSALRKPHIASARAHSILRTANEREATGQFGLLDLDALDQREATRLAMQEKQRAERLAIKRDAPSEADRRSEWEQSANARAKTLGDIYGSLNLDLDDLED